MKYRDAIRKRIAEATPGPWRAGADGWVVCSTGNSGETGEDCLVSAHISSGRLCDSASDAKTDAQFIAHGRADLEALFGLKSILDAEAE